MTGSYWGKLALVAASMVAVDVSRAADKAATGYTRDVKPLLKKYCYDCHGSHLDKPKGKLDLERFGDEASILADRGTWKDVRDALEFRDMPPKKDPQPTDHERGVLTRWVAKILATPDLGGKRDPGRPILRRLTRTEYNNTVRDLLALNTDVFGFPERLPNEKDYFVEAAEARTMPAELKVRWREYGAKMPTLLRSSGLPGDSRAEHGFMNRGDAMNFSPVLLEKYLAVADDVLTAPKLLDESPVMREMFPGVTPPKPTFARRPVVATSSTKDPRFNPGLAMPKPKGGTVPAVEAFAANDNVATVAPESSSTPNGLTAGIAEAFADNRGGVFDAPNKAIRGNAIKPGADGGLIIPFGVDRKHQLALITSAELWVVGFGTADESSGDVLITNKQKGAKVFDLHFDVFRDDPELGIAELGVVVLSRDKQSGPVTLTATFSDGGTTTLTKAMQPGAGKDNTLFAFAAPPGLVIRRLRVDGSSFTGDFVLIDDIGFIVRPYERSDEPVTVADAKADAPEPQQQKAEKPATQPEPAPVRFEDAEVRQRLAAFMRRAFRRPVTDAEVAPYFEIYRTRTMRGADDVEGLRQTLRAVLASPHFLYLIEPNVPDAGPVRELTDHELATRLSYFLWSSSPDAELMELAEGGKLRDPDVLTEQARRMLRDPKAKELSESFAFQWLQLNELLSARPDRRIYKAYYAGPQGKRTLTADMTLEAILMFETVMVEDRSVVELIDADWTYLNNKLIRHYGYDDAFADELAKVAGTKRGADSRWFRVSLPDRRRGGVFTTGAALTLTSLPNRTSLIKRGAWMLEAVFNRPPPPPVANAGEIPEGDEDGRLTLREKVTRHRADPACAVCHDRIDPLGFALENYDGIGRWREAADDLAIDPSGVLPTGQAFRGPVELKDILVDRKRDFVRGFVEHTLSYALGRKLEYYDDPTVTRIVDAMTADGDRFSTLITQVVRSYPFRHVRNTEMSTDAQASTSE